jgi:lysyl-tRNA synthetase class 1
VGHVREILTADAVVRALRERGVEVTLNYIADSYDPLRRVYPFLDPSYEEHVGRPLSQVPCTCGGHASYADHFLEPFLEAVGQLGVELTLLPAHRMYEEGCYAETIFEALEAMERIAAILREETGKETAPEWSPFFPLCPGCGRLNQTRVTGWDREGGSIAYACECGSSGEVPAAGGGKLTWRVDWPARWKITGCTFEPFGKDHATAGGSYDTGHRIAEEVFGYPTPGFVTYEWISLRGRGDMSSSKGNVLTVEQGLEVMPPEALRFLLMDRSPNRRIEFDMGQALFTLLSEYDRRAANDPADRALALSHVTGLTRCPVPFQHLATVVQVTDAALGTRETTEAEWDKEFLAILERSGYRPGGSEEREVILRRARNAARWVELYAPETVRFEVQQSLPAVVRGLREPVRRALRLLAGLLGEEGLDAEAIHKRVHEVKEREGIGAKDLFRAIYLALLGTEQGPRAGHLIAALGTDWVRRRLLDAAEA